MNPNMNSQSFPPVESFDKYHSFGSNPPPRQDFSARGRTQSHYQGPYPTTSPRIRQQRDFQPRGRYPYNRRGGNYRPQNPDNNFDQQQEQSLDNNEYQATTTNPSNRNFNRYFRESMLENPWTNVKSRKVPSDGTSLVVDSTNS